MESRRRRTAKRNAAPGPFGHLEGQAEGSRLFLLCVAEGERWKARNEGRGWRRNLTDPSQPVAANSALRAAAPSASWIKNAGPSDPLFDELAFHQADRAAVGRVHRQIGRQAELGVDRRGDVVGEVLVADDFCPFVVRRAQNGAAGNARTGHHGEAARGPVVAAAGRVDLRRAAEVGQPHDERRVEQAALRQIGDELGQPLVDRAARAA